MARFSSFRSFLRRFHRAATSIPIRVKKPTCRLTLEELEDRLAPATVQFLATSQVFLDTSGAFSIPVTLSAALTQPVSIPYTITGTATAGVDYTGLSASPLVILAGQTSTALTGTFLNDGVADGNKSILLSLGTPTGATLGADSVDSVTISESAVNPTILSIAAASQIEPALGSSVNMNFTVTRTGDLTSPLTVGYTTIDGSAVGGTDYTPRTGTTTFAAGSAIATIGIPILGSGIGHNPAATFSVELTGIVSGADGPNFSPPAAIADLGSPVSVTTGDLNGDGKPDLVVADNSNGGNSVKIFLNTTPTGSATPTFSTPLSFTLPSSPDSVAIADINGDNKPDVIVAGEFVSVFMNTMATGATTPSFAAAVQFTPGLNAETSSIAVGDVNGDHKPDIVTTNFAANVVSVLLNTTPTGAAVPTFAASEQFAVGATPESVALADINGDGKLDVVVANGGAASASVLLNTTAIGATIASFAPRVDIPLAGRLQSIAVGDFNGDGKPDLVVTDRDDDFLSVLLNTTPTGASTPTFSAHEDTSLGATPAQVITGDFNGDGKVDIAAILVPVGNGPAIVSVFLNTTTPGAAAVTLQRRQEFAAASFSRALATDDFNGDGRADIVATSAASDAISFLLSSPGIISVGTAIGSIASPLGPPSPTNSTLFVSPTSIPVGGTTTVTLRAKDANGNSETSGGATVTFDLGAGPALGAFGSVIDNDDGTYSATLSAGTLAGANTITATINGQAVTSALPSVTVTPGPVSMLQSTVAITSSIIQSGTSTTVTLQAEDANGNDFTTGGLPVHFALGAGNATGVFGLATDNHNGTYTASFTGILVGSSIITATINGQAVTSPLPTITVIPGVVSLSLSTLSASSANVPVLGATTVTLRTKDANGNDETSGGLVVTMRNVGAAGNTLGAVTDNNDGTYAAAFTAGTLVGANTISAAVGGQAVVSTRPTITVTPGPADFAQSTISIASSVAAGASTTVTLQSEDAFGNHQASGGLTVAFALGNGAGGGTLGPVIDHGNGVYTAAFTGGTLGSNTITATINAQAVTSQAPSTTVTQGPVSYALSTISISPISIPAGTSATATLTVRDVGGNLYTGNAAVAFAVASGPISGGAFSTATDLGNGVYTASFNGVTAGTGTVTATIFGIPLTSALPSITVTPLAFDHFKVAATSGAVAVTAQDGFNNATSAFTGSVHLASVNNKSAPIDYTYSATADAGQHLFNLATASGVDVTNLSNFAGPAPANIVVQANLKLNAGQYAGLVTRYSGPTDKSMYFGGIVPSPTGHGFVAAIWVSTTGSLVPLTALVPMSSAQGTLYFEADGSSLQLFWMPASNGVLALLTAANNTSLSSGAAAVRIGQGVTVSNVVATAVSSSPTNVPFSEDFTAGNYPTTFNAGLSSSWQEQAGVVSIVNGAAAGRLATNLATLNGVNTTNEYAQADVTLAQSGQFAGLVTRYQGTGDKNMYWAAVLWSGSQFEAGIWINRNGISTPLGPLTAITAPPSHSPLQGTLLFEAVGSSLRLFWQPLGVSGFSLVASATNTAFTTGSVGMRISANATLTNFSADVPVVPAPQNAAIPFAENFTDPTNPSGLGSQLSSFWKNQVGNLSIVNGNATSQAALNVATLNGVNAMNGTVQATVTVPKGKFAGLVARYSGTGDRNMYFAEVTSSGAGYVAAIWINFNGVWTRLTPLVSVGNLGQGVLGFKTVGSSLQLFWNGVLIVSATNARLTTGSVGVRLGQGASLADFSAS